MTGLPAGPAGGRPSARRPRARTWLAVALLTLPVIEIAVLLRVGEWIGAVPAVLLLVLGSVLGAVVVRHEGLQVWRALRGTVRGGRVPGRELADSALVLVGGTMLLVPGLVTDLAGLVLVLPPGRAAVRVLLLRYLARRFAGGAGAPFAHGGPPRVVRGELADGPGEADG